MSSSLSDINPRLRAFFSSRFVMVDAGQSPGASLAMAAAVSGSALVGAAVTALEPVALAVALAMEAEFFFSIFGKDPVELWRSERNRRLGCNNGGMQRAKEEEEDCRGEVKKISGSPL
jgi:hypothetical protein